MTTPLYDAVAEDLGWSLEDLGEPFDLAGRLAEAGALARGRQAVAGSLRRELDRRIDAAVDEWQAEREEAER